MNQVRSGRGILSGLAAFLAISVFSATLTAAPAAKILPVTDHGGKVIPNSNTYAIWWGTAADFPSDEQYAIENILSGLGCTDLVPHGSTIGEGFPCTPQESGYLAIANQYLRGASATTAFKGSWADPSAPPSHQPSVATIVAEVSKFLTANSLQPDPNGVYLVYTSNFLNGGSCAWHSSGVIGTTTVQVAYLPNTSGVKGCDAGTPFGGYTEGTRSVADSTAHEFMESITDPLGTAWYDKNGAEIGDKCNATVGLVSLSNGFAFYIQPEWSNAAAGCVLTAP